MGNETYPIKHVIALGLKTVTDEGDFISSANANVRGIFSTAHLVKQALTEGAQNLIAEFSEVDKVVDYVNNFDPLVNNNTAGDYYDRLKEVYAKDEVSYKEVAMVVSALAFFNNPKLPSSDYRDMITNSKYIGELKSRDNFFVKLLKETYLQTQNCFVYKFISRDGDLGFFFKGEKLDLTPGDCFMFKGTPIDHSEDRYDKVPITKFNRIAHIENHGSKTGE